MKENRKKGPCGCLYYLMIGIPHDESWRLWVPSFLSLESCNALAKLCAPGGDACGDDGPTMLSMDDDGLPDSMQLLLASIEDAIGRLTGQSTSSEETPLLPLHVSDVL